MSLKHTPRTTLPRSRISPKSEGQTTIISGSPEINFCITARFLTYAPNVRFNAGRMTRCIASWLAGIAVAERLRVDEPMVGSEGRCCTWMRKEGWLWVMSVHDSNNDDSVPLMRLGYHLATVPATRLHVTCRLSFRFGSMIECLSTIGLFS